MRTSSHLCAYASQKNTRNVPREAPAATSTIQIIGPAQTPIDNKHTAAILLGNAPLIAGGSHEHGSHSAFPYSALGADARFWYCRSTTSSTVSARLIKHIAAVGPPCPRALHDPLMSSSGLGEGMRRGPDREAQPQHEALAAHAARRRGGERRGVAAAPQ